MSWTDVKNTIAKSAPVLGGLLGPVGGLAGTLIASALGVENEPDAVLKALANDPEAITKIKLAEIENKTKLEEMLIQQEMNALTETNKTIRAELAVHDKFKSYWRPMFGYMGAFAWLAQTLTIVSVLIYAMFADEAAKVALLLTGMTDIVTALTPQWAVLLSVLGVGMVKRSHDKTGLPSKGLLSGLLK